ncbi:hypothetical protein HNP38_001154 [Chryseobacterium defluvii]|uniref:Uncharacterized protein n=1 Tax=Chryseobacterium defluvii TaxID=160396 RepID=A0A840KG22_9FLAO|nr:hypothetical protein [Chryseobacterium defluvii]
MIPFNEILNKLFLKNLITPLFKINNINVIKIVCPGYIVRLRKTLMLFTVIIFIHVLEILQAHQLAVYNGTVWFFWKL